MASMLDDLSLLTTLHRQVVEESGRIDRRASFRLLRYANCWEDADV